MPLTRWTRAYGSSLRETFPVEETPADDLVNLLDQADRRRAYTQDSVCGAGD